MQVVHTGPPHQVIYKLHRLTGIVDVVHKITNPVNHYEFTGVVVSCQTQRSQFQNRDYAMEMLKAKLYQIAKQQHMDKRCV